MKDLIQTLIFMAGLGHLFLSLGSLLIPRLLSWHENLAVIKPLFRQMFWVYAAYTLMTNVFFGLISVLAPEELLNHTTLAICLSGFIALYWVGRLVIQFFYFDRKSTPKGWIYVVGEISLTSLFVFFSIVYTYAFIMNIQKW